jgi:hypothetical protein
MMALNASRAVSPTVLHGLVGAWCPSLGPSGYTLLDRSGGGNHGVLTNMDAASDWVGTPGGWALDFDGSNDWINIPRPRQIAATGVTQFTVSYWVKLRSGYGVTLRCRSTTGLIVYSATNLSGGIQIGTGGTYPIYSATKLTAGSWAHCVVVFDNKAVSLFLDGRLDGTGTSANLPNFGTDNFRFGGVGGVETTNGQYGDFGFWLRAMTAPEVSALYRAGQSGLGRLLTQRRRRVYGIAATAAKPYLFLHRGQVIGGGIR